MSWFLKMMQNLLAQGRRDREPVLPAHEAKDAAQLARAVVREFDETGEAGMQAGVAGNETLHLLRVTGHDDNQPVAIVLHSLEQGFDGLGAEILAVLGQAVSLVNEQDAIQCRVNHRVGARRSLAHSSALRECTGATTR